MMPRRSTVLAFARSVHASLAEVPAASAVRRRGPRGAFAACALAFALPAGDLLAQEACPDGLAPDATAVGSTVSCDSRVDSLAKVVDADIGTGSSIGARSTVYASRLEAVTLGEGSQVVAVRAGELELPVTFGAGSIVYPGVRAFAADVGAGAVIGRGSRLSGGRGIDFQFIGARARIGENVELGVRRLGDDARIGDASRIGESTTAGDAFSFGERSVWVVGGEIGNGVTIGDDVRIEGGFDAADGVSIGNGVSVGFRVSIGESASLYREAVLGNGSRIGANALIGRGADIGGDAVVGERVLVLRRATIGAGADIGAGSVVDANAAVAAGAVVPANSRVAADGSVTPL